MSRSYRRPYAPITGASSAREDKQRAARGARRVYDRELRRAAARETWDEFVLPDRRECPWNNVWGWDRDGRQRLQVFPSRWDREYLARGLVRLYERQKLRFDRLGRK